jgi:hypothetical protein
VERGGEWWCGDAVEQDKQSREGLRFGGSWRPVKRGRAETSAERSDKFHAARADENATLGP